ncbi:unnamed protein product [Caenorhabditis auriculariae]|uniref:Uncharacterized protein n=1 Tax=Caenorhabditis auriculariae TaxID=2777116 RepID=A0A8S1HGH0_9PELO|nr:unnamed protein product [Caenorhabditis auriculariae]
MTRTLVARNGRFRAFLVTTLVASALLREKGEKEEQLGGWTAVRRRRRRRRGGCNGRKNSPSALRATENDRPRALFLLCFFGPKEL